MITGAKWATRKCRGKKVCRGLKLHNTQLLGCLATPLLEIKLLSLSELCSELFVVSNKIVSESPKSYFAFQSWQTHYQMQSVTKVYQSSTTRGPRGFQQTRGSLSQSLMSSLPRQHILICVKLLRRNMSTSKCINYVYSGNVFGYSLICVHICSPIHFNVKKCNFFALWRNT